MVKPAEKKKMFVKKDDKKPTDDKTKKEPPEKGKFPAQKDEKKQPPKAVDKDKPTMITISKTPKGSLDSRIDLDPPVEVDADSGQTLREFFENAVDFDSFINDQQGVSEALTVAQRMKRKMIIRRNKNRLKIKRHRALIRRAPQRTALKRARRMAINSMKKRYSHGQPTSKLSYSERSRIEKIIRKRKPAVNRLQRRLVRQVRKIENRRLHNSIDVDLTMPMLFEIFNEMWDTVNHIERNTNAV